MLGPGEAHLWVVDYGDPSWRRCLPPYMGLLSAQERARMHRLRFVRHQQRFALAHGLLRTSLSWCAPGVQPGDWAFARLPSGRPEIAQPRAATRLRFSLSHAGELAAVVVVRDVDCGVDVETARRGSDVALLAGSVLAEEERRDVESSPDGEATFLRYWTLKEAYGKARGLGLSLRPDAVRFHLGAPAISLTADPAVEPRPAEWQFAQHRTAAWTVAVALRAGREAACTLVRHLPPQCATVDGVEDSARESSSASSGGRRRGNTPGTSQAPGLRG